MKRSTISLLLAALALLGVLTACSKPAETTPPAPPAQEQPPADNTTTPTPNPSDPGQTDVSPGEVDIAVRQVLQGYIDALKQENYQAAAAFWDPRVSVLNPDDLKTPGLSGWFFQSSEMIDSTADTAFVQLNFEVKVAPGTATPYTDGKNARFVRLARLDGQWKIVSMATSP